MNVHFLTSTRSLLLTALVLLLTTSTVSAQAPTVLTPTRTGIRPPLVTTGSSAPGIERNIPVLETKEQIFARRRPGPLDTAVQSVPGTLGVPTILVGFEGLGPASRRSVIGVAVPAGAG